MKIFQFLQDLILKDKKELYNLSNIISNKIFPETIAYYQLKIICYFYACKKHTDTNAFDYQNITNLNLIALADWLIYNPTKPLLFTQVHFWIFFLAVYGIFSLIYKNTFWRNTWLFAVSGFFYYKSSGLFFSLIIISIIINFFIGNKIFKSKYVRLKKRWVAVSIIYNLTWLIYFKYTYFFLSLSDQWFNINLEAKDFLMLGINNITGSNFDASKIILPVGISFYTFQIISYIVDIYRGKVNPVKNILDFGFYVSFFPQLVAGPIVRASNFIPQMYQPFRLEKEEFGKGLFFILNGLIKKIIIANYISINFVDRVFDAPLAYTGLENLLAVYGYSIQIYCDFSGYTDIAIGLALIMGFRLPLNFNSPYKASNISDFWRRWHISLSSWLKDYLYIPLGGNKKGKIRTFINLFITMLLGGLWHGANIRFIIWGALHGIYLALHKVFLLFVPNQNKKWQSLRIFFTFHIVAFTWVVFRANSLVHIQNMFKQIVFNFNGVFVFEILLAYKNILLLMLLAFIIHWLPEKLKNWYRGKFVLMPYYLQAIAVIIIIFVLAQFYSAKLQPFIYFQF